ncbi:MAG: response regulator [Nitrospirae bacterium]|nr:response regulator [Nitrospirota bacterium]
MDKRKFKILIAEDDEIVRDVISKFVTGEGYAVVAASDGLAALKLLRLEDIKLVLTDLRMPGADGMEVLRKAIQINPRIAVVLMTAYGTLDTALDAMKEGAYDYIVKPFVMQQLLLVVRNAYKVAALYEENDNLTNELKETCRILEALKKSNNIKSKHERNDSWERNEKPDNPGTDDANDEFLKERLASENVNGNVKKYSNLVNDLKK